MQKRSAGATRRKILAEVDVGEEKMGVEIIEKYFDATDRMVFQGQIRKKMAIEGATLSFAINRKKDWSMAGRCVGKQKNNGMCFRLTLWSFIFSTVFCPGDGMETVEVNGIPCRSRQECILVVVQHEMVHLVMMLWGYDGKKEDGSMATLGEMDVATKAALWTSVYSSHGEMFQRLAKEFFGQTSYTHQLANGDTAGHLTFDHCHVGKRVECVDRPKKKIYLGVVKSFDAEKVTVLTDDGYDLDVKYVALRSVR